MKKVLLIVILLLLSFWTIKPLFHQGFFNVHDNVQVERVFEMGQALKMGQLPVRWVQDLGYGYGYPLYNFYAPLPYYVGGILNVVGFDALSATKLMFGLGILLAVFSMFLLANKLWGVWGGLLSAVLYIYSPYHALDIYVRGAVDEFWATGFLPLVFFGMYKIYRKENYQGLLIGIIGFTGIILSHNLSALMLVPFLLLFIVILLLVSPDKKYFLLNTIYFVLLSLSISAFYWLPALAEMKYTDVLSQLGGGADFHNHFISFNQIWDFPWGFGGSAGLLSGLSFKIGKPNLILLTLALLLFLFFYKTYKDKKIVMIFGSIGFIISVILTNKISVGVWDIIKPLAFVQYPWRFLEFSVLFSSLLSGFVFFVLVTKFDLKLIRMSTVVVILLTIFYHSKYFAPQEYLNLTSTYYTNLSHLNRQASKISDEYLPKDFPKIQALKNTFSSKITSKPEISISNIKNNNTSLVFNTRSMNHATISVMMANFPGWKVWVDGKLVELAQSPFLTFTVGQGEHNIQVLFTNTFVRSLANLISLLGIAVTGVILARKKYS